MGKMSNKTGLILFFAAILLLPSEGMSQQTIRWETTLESAELAAGRTNRLVLIHFSAPWCGVCKRMEAEVLVQPSVTAELSADYVAVKINADQFPALAERYGVTALPTTVIVSPDGQMLENMRGWVDADPYVARLSRVAGEARQRRAETAQLASRPAAPPVSPAQPAARPEVTGPATPAASLPPAYGRPVTPIGTPPPTMTAPAPAATAPAYGASAAPTVPAVPAGPPPASRYESPTAPSSQPSGPRLPSNPPQNVAPQNNLPSNNLPQGVAPTGNPAIANRPAGPMAGNAPQGGVLPPPPAGSPPWGLDGYCPVTLCEKQKWIRGDRRWGAIHRGRTYLFAGPQEQQRFLANPDGYAPVASGNDVVVAAEQGQIVPGTREHGVFYKHRIYLFSSEASLQKFSTNSDAYDAARPLEALRAGANPGLPVR
jgi:thiol-disulfide isomerase/thioredoxin/YHS domain-containing protein